MNTVEGHGGTVATHRAPVVALVDWENLRRAIRSHGYVAGPCVVLNALITALERCTPGGHDGELARVELHFPAGVESATDYGLLAGCDDRVVMVEPWRNHNGKNMADMELALSAVRRFYEPGDDPARCLFIVSNDADLARVAAFLAAPERRAAGAGRGHACVAVCRWGAQYGGREEIRTAEVPCSQLRQAMENGLGTSRPRRLKPRPWNQWDDAAWSLANAVAVDPVRRTRKIDDAVAKLLDGHEGRWERAFNAGLVEISDLELVDGIVASLWLWQRPQMGLPFTRSEAEARVQQVFGLSPDKAAKPIDALLLAGLIRGAGEDLLEVPRRWAEGLLQPLRRSILKLQVTDGERNPMRLSGHHRRSVEALAHDAPSADLDAVTADLRKALTNALRNMGAARLERQGQKQRWILRRGNWLVEDTLKAARRTRSPVLGLKMKQAACTARNLAPGFTPASRWLRLLDDAGILEYHRDVDRWEAGPNFNRL